MKARQLLLAGALGLLALAGTATAQPGPYVSPRMYVVVKFRANHQAWDYAPQVASSAAMTLVGVSPSTNSAVYIVPNETDLNNGDVAGRNQALVLRQFSGLVESYSYGANYPLPPDVLTTRAPQAGAGYYPNYGKYGNTGNTATTGNTQPTRNNPYAAPPQQIAPPQQTAPRQVTEPRPYTEPRQYNEYRFTNRDRQAAQEWFDQNRTAGPRPQAGTVLDPQVLAETRPAPADLVRRLSAGPGDYRFLILNDYLVAVDGRSVVVDVVEFDR